MLREEWAYALGQYGKSAYDDQGWSPKPGDAVCDIQDRWNTFGVVISVLPCRFIPNRVRVRVLWTQDIDLLDVATRRLADQMQREVDAEIIKDLERLL